MNRLNFIILISFLLLSCNGQVNKENDQTIDNVETDSKNDETKNKWFGKNKHQYVITIKNPKFHVLQIPQPFEYVLEVKVNGKSSIRHFPVQKTLGAFNSHAYVQLESSPNKQSGTFKGNAKFEISYVKGYSGFTLWIDGKKVKDTEFGTLKYNYQDKD